MYEHFKRANVEVMAKIHMLEDRHEELNKLYHKQYEELIVYRQSSVGIESVKA